MMNWGDGMTWYLRAKNDASMLFAKVSCVEGLSNFYE